VNLLRPHQWIKNLLILFPPFFGGLLLYHDTIYLVVPAVLVFSAAASSSYIINDIQDASVDKNHSKKKNRPIACGEISKVQAMSISIALFSISIISSFYISGVLWMYILAYLLISLSYTFFFKNVVILDIFFISAGFMIRVLAGGAIFNIEVSHWLFLTVFLVSLFLASGKRLAELLEMGTKAAAHRKSLSNYNPSFIEGVLWFAASAALVTYSLYTIEEKSALFYTVPLTAFGLLRYIYIVKTGVGDPTDILLSDGQIMTTGIVWAIAIGIIKYGT